MATLNCSVIEGGSIVGMKTYHVKVEWSGYCRGTSTYLVQANSEEEAKDNWWEGECIDHRTLRDDTEKEVLSAKEDAAI